MPFRSRLSSQPEILYAIRIYDALEGDAIHIIRILHGKRDVLRILQSE